MKRLGEVNEEQIHAWENAGHVFIEFEVKIGDDIAVAYINRVTKSVLLISETLEDNRKYFDMYQVYIKNLWLGGYEPLKLPQTKREDMASLSLGKKVKAACTETGVFLPHALIFKNGDHTKIEIFVDGKSATCTLDLPDRNVLDRALYMNGVGKYLEGGLEILKHAIDITPELKDPKTYEEEMAQCKAAYMAWSSIDMPEASVKKKYQAP